MLQTKQSGTQIRAIDSLLSPTKRGTKKAAVEQGFLTKGETLLGCFDFFIIDC